MQGDSKAITPSKEQKKFECHETTGSRSPPVTRAITFITNKTKKPLGDKCEKNLNIFIIKAIASGTIVSLTINQEVHYKQRSQRSRMTKQVFVYYNVFEISGNSKGESSSKTWRAQKFYSFLCFTIISSLY